ncbi:unnamed protein product [Cyprideis torosa]|uniref:Eukaryotic translation initiation factor 5 n=1 Tax=Cyprideis torosa TaxID=163714 RepID=A0A7R8W857_9CRUS|nr:unnamed protein product [Cyprideis torosa]CAG0883970.1 unnamed protein product [Cyprideis torosa]
MAGTYNVNRSVTDPFYRYKMPRIISKVEGKGNGIKTVIPNMADIAKALGRPPTYPTKYFGCELGAQVQFDFKNERYIVNGSHDSGKLQQLLDGFIRKFVLCPSCENPETVYTVQAKKGIVTSRCKACGNSSTLDLSHRLTTFILKNPPDAPLGSTGASLSKKDKKKGKVEKGTGVARNGSSPTKKTEGEEEEEACDDDEVSAGGGDQSGYKDATERLIVQDEEEEEVNEDDWGEDATEEAARQRINELTEGVKNLATCDDLERSEKERADILYSFIKEKRDQGQLSKAGVDKEILAEGERLDIKDKVALVLAELLLSENILKELKQHNKVFLRATIGNDRAQRYLMRGVEMVIAAHRETLIPKVPHVLKQLYDQDIVEEDVFTEWGKKPSKKSRIEYDERARVTQLKEMPVNDSPAKQATAGVIAAAGDQADDDIDIDDI